MFSRFTLGSFIRERIEEEEAETVKKSKSFIYRGVKG
jgi:hypothetical protein